MQRDGVNICVARPVRLKLGSPLQLAERVVGPFQASERQAQCVMQSGVLWGQGDHRPQYPFAVAIPAELSVKISQVDGRRRKLWAKPKCSAIFSLGFDHQAAPCVEISESRARLGAIG